jgi:hypothetical protein
LPKERVRLGAKAFTAECGCFVTRASGATELNGDKWRQLADRYGITFNGWLLSNAEDSELTALSRTFEFHRPWLKRAVRKRLTA